MSQAPQPAYAGPQSIAAPPRRRRKWPIVLLVLAVLIIAGIAGCVAVVGSGAKAVSDSLDKTAEKDAPRDVTVGKEFTIGSHQTLAGWKVTKDTDLGDPEFNVVGKVKNTSDTTSTSFIHFKFLTASGEVIGNVSCNSGDLEPGQTQTLNCIPDGKFGKYAKVTAEADF